MLPSQVMFLRNHGVVCCGSSIEEAFHICTNTSNFFITKFILFYIFVSCCLRPPSEDDASRPRQPGSHRRWGKYCLCLYFLILINVEVNFQTIFSFLILSLLMLHICLQHSVLCFYFCSLFAFQTRRKVFEIGQRGGGGVNTAKKEWAVISWSWFCWSGWSWCWSWSCWWRWCWSWSCWWGWWCIDYGAEYNHGDGDVIRRKRVRKLNF